MVISEIVLACPLFSFGDRPVLPEVTLRWIIGGFVNPTLMLGTVLGTSVVFARDLGNTGGSVDGGMEIDFGGGVSTLVASASTPVARGPELAVAASALWELFAPSVATLPWSLLSQPPESSASGTVDEVPTLSIGWSSPGTVSATEYCKESVLGLKVVVAISCLVAPATPCDESVVVVD